MIEPVTVSLSAFAILISLWSAFQSHRSAKQQSEWQERLLHLENRNRGAVQQPHSRLDFGLSWTEAQRLQHSW